MLEKYNTRKALLEQLMGRIDSFVTYSESRRELSLLKGKLRDNTFNLAVLGQFKRGKTSFINALLGRHLLPTGIVPLTSIICIIKYAKEPVSKVFFLDDKEKTIDIKDICLYVTEKQNPENRKSVLFVEIGYPSDYLKGGVLLIDTPGIGSTLLHNTQSTYEYLRKIDAAIFILSADPPISQTELEFLKDARKHIPKIFFVLNKADYLGRDELNEILKFNQRILEKELGQKVTIFPLSAKAALEGKLQRSNTRVKESRIKEFEGALCDFFMKEKGDIFITSIQNGLVRIIDEAIGYYELEAKTSQMPLMEAEQKLQEFREAAAEIRKEQDEAEPIIKAEISKIMEGVDEDLEAFKKETEPYLTNALVKSFHHSKAKGNREIVQLIQMEYIKLIGETFEPWRIKEEEKVKGLFEKTIGRYSHSINRIVEKIKKLSSESFKVELPHLPTQETFTLDSRLYYRVEEMYTLLSDEFKLMLPGVLFKKLLLKEINEGVSQHLEMNSGRIRSDFLERLTNSSRQYVDILNEQVDTSIKDIEQAAQRGIKEKQRSKARIQQFAKEHKEKVEMMVRLKQDLMLNRIK